MNSRLLPIFMLLLLSLLSGCATVDQKINLTYKPGERTFGKASGEVAVSRVDPASAVRNSKGEWIIGSLNNTHGIKQADLLSDKSIGEWISSALVEELKLTGYSAVYSPQLPAGASRGVVLNEIIVFMNANKGAVSTETKQELKFNVDVVINGAKVKTLTIATIDKKTLMSASQEEKELIMRQSLQDAMQQMVPQLIALFEKK